MATNKVIQSFRLKKDIIERLEFEARARGINKTEELDRVLRRYYNSRICW